jgi:hypothetical protein
MSKSSTLQANLLNILRKESQTSTKRIIELACSPGFQEACRDCGIEVYDTAMRLYRAGLITRTPKEGGFVWAVVENEKKQWYKLPQE